MKLWDEGQLAALMDALDLTRRGNPSMLLVHGDPGAGKTALLDELEARAQGFAVLAADGLETGARPFHVLAQWGVEPVPPTATTDALPFIAGQLLQRRIDDLTTRRPLLLRLDDLHWADPESVEAISWMLRRVSGDRLLVAVGTRPLRPDQHVSWQRLTAARRQAIHVVLNGLSLDHARALVRHHHSTLDPSLAAQLWQHTSGNPLYLTALLQEYDPEQLAQTRLLPAPAAYTQVLNARIARLPPDSVSVLRAAAVLGPRWIALADVGVVAQVKDPSRAVQVLTEQGLVHSQTLDGIASVRLAHALVRAAVYHQTPLPERSLLHEHAASLMPNELAVLEHRMAAARTHDEQLADAMETYARRLYGERSFRLAAQHQRWASTLTAEPRLREQRWLESLFQLAMAGDVGPIHVNADRVRRSDHRVLRGLVLGVCAAWERRRADAIGFLEPLAALPEGALDPTARYRVEVLLAWVRIGAGQPGGLVADGLERARQMGITDPGLAGIDLVSSGSIRLRQLGPAATLDELSGIAQVRAAVPPEQTDQLAWRGAVRAELGFMPEAITDLSECARRTQDGVTPFGAGSFHAFLAYAQWMDGDWAQARLNFRLAFDISGEDVHPMILTLAPLLPLGEGDAAAAAKLLAQADGVLRQAPWFEACQLLVVTHIVRLHAVGTPAERARFLTQTRGGFLDASTLLSRSTPILSLHLALAATWAGDSDFAETCIRELEEARPQAPWVSSVAAWLSALVHEQEGDDRAALRCLGAALRQQGSALPLYRAHQWADQARLARRIGRRADAANSRARAEQLYRSLGAKRFLSRVTATHSLPLSPTPVLLSVVLTERERDVLTLVLAGLSYAQIARRLYITQSTVGYHLSNVYAKAGVSSRHVLADLVRAEPRRFGFSEA